MYRGRPDHDAEQEREHERFAEHRRQRAGTYPPSALVTDDQPERAADDERHEHERPARAEHPREEARQDHVGAVPDDASRRANRRDRLEQLVREQEREREQQAVAM